MLDKDNQNNTQRLQIWQPLLFALVLVLGMLLGFKLERSFSKSSAPVTSNKVTKSSEVKSIEELLGYIEAKYIEDTDREVLMQNAINGILKDLDPHSTYISASKLQGVNEGLEGEFDGIGVEFYILNDTILVVSPISGGPSESVGIRAGDRIIEIEDSLVAGVGITNEGVTKQLRGEKGSDVKIAIKRAGNEDLLPFTITRDKIPIHSLDVHYMLDDETGYVKISRFSATTYKEFVDAMEDMNKKGLKDLVIDLRQNPGGYLSAATKILDQLFIDKKLLVYTEGRTQSRKDYKSTGRAYYTVRNVAVLIDEGSASASEILAGAVQDQDRGKIIGRRSFGKGLVQEQYDLSDGSALRLTVARYYTPSGRSIQKAYDGKDGYDTDIEERFLSGEMENQDSIQVKDSTRFYTAGGRVVYAGGGITPDVFIPIDSIINNEYYIRSVQYVQQFMYRYLDDNRPDFEVYENLKQFERQFSAEGKLFNEFVEYVAQKDIRPTEDELLESKAHLKTRLKAHLGRHLFKEVGFYTIMNAEDPVLKAAMKELR